MSKNQRLEIIKIKHNDCDGWKTKKYTFVSDGFYDERNEVADFI